MKPIGKFAWPLGLLLASAFGSASADPVAGTTWKTTITPDVTYRRGCPSDSSQVGRLSTFAGTVSFGVDGHYALQLQDGQTINDGSYTQSGNNLNLMPAEHWLNRKNVATFMPRGLFRPQQLRKIQAGRQKLLPRQATFNGNVGGTPQTLTLTESRLYQFPNDSGNGQLCSNRLSLKIAIHGRRP